jgi:cell division protein FtsI (penicillin-binding protein 3)
MGKATLNSKFFCCNGLYASPRGGIIRDAPGERFGELPLSEIVVFSSNIGMARLGETLGNPILYKISHAFGFGQTTGIDLPGEDNGRLSPLSKWTSYDTYRLPFGQGQIMVTCLQLANGFSTIANGGVMYKPRLVDRIVAPDGQVVFQSQPTKIRRVIDRAVARQFIDDVLTQVVERGTGKKARSEHWQILGKTGTAQIGSAHGYVDRAFTGTFMGAGPATNPRVVCVISVYHPTKEGHYGGTVAAPYVKEVLEKTLAYLDVPPDQVEDVKTAGTGADVGNGW